MVLPFWTNMMYLLFQTTYWGSGNLNYHCEPFQGHTMIDYEIEILNQWLENHMDL